MYRLLKVTLKEFNVGQSEIFCSDEANKYIERNKKQKTIAYSIKYLLEIFSKKELTNYDIAEFGIGAGYNLNYLSYHANNVHGYDASKKAVDLFYESAHPEQTKRYFGQQVNLCESFETKIKYDLIIWGFFAYYVDNEEILVAKENTVNALNNNGYVYINDFLVKEKVIKEDSRNKKLKVHKRNLLFWQELFKDMTLVDFRLFKSNNKNKYIYDSTVEIDSDLGADDSQWEFCALFKYSGDGY